MKRLPLVSAIMVMVMALDFRLTSLSPLSGPINREQPMEKEPPGNRRDSPSGPPRANIMQPAANPSQSHQPISVGGAPISSQPSQAFNMRQSMQSKDPHPNRQPSGSPGRSDFISTNHGESARRQDYNNSLTNLSYGRADLMIEGSGLGPSRSNGSLHGPRLDDTEDSSDDEEDKDDDYDDGDTLDSGSGHGQIAGTPQSSSSVRNDAVGRLQSNDFPVPFRQPITTTDSQQIRGTSSSTKPIATTRAPLRVLQTTPVAMVGAITTSAPTSSSRPMTSTTTTSRNLVAINKNRTKGEVDYDYDDPGEDDDSEDSSVFEDNDPLEVSVSGSNSKSRPDSTTYPNIMDSKKRPSTTRTPSSGLDHVVKSPTSNPSTEIAIIPTRYQTTPAPTPPQMVTKPALIKQTTTQAPKTESRPTSDFPDSNREDDKRPMDEDDDNDEEQEDDDEKDDIEDDSQDDDEPNWASRPTNSSSRLNQANNRPDQQPKPIKHGPKSAQLPNQPNSRPTASPSREKYNKSTEIQTSISKAKVIIPSNPTTHLSVPILIATTTAIPTTTKMPMTSVSPEFKIPVEVTTSKTVPFAQSPRITSSSSTTIGPVLVSETEKPAIRFSTSLNTRPDNRSPQAKGTTSLSQYENNDTLTRQVYEKAVEVYLEADRTVRAAWQAVWPPDMNFESSVMEPLLDQPLFFMLALGGTVICIVLLFLLVVYIITYQIQPKDDDISIY